MLFGVSLLAVLGSTIAAFALGGAWYSVLFGKAWTEVAGVPGENKTNPALVYPTLFVLNLFASFAFGFLFAGSIFQEWILRGCLTGLCLVVFSMAINYLGAGRPLKLLLIDGTFQFARLSIFGVVFGLVSG